MGRQVVFDPAPTFRDSGEDRGDKYVDKVLKLIPAETVAVYMSLDGVLRSALVQRESSLQNWLWVTFVGIAIGNVLYLRQVAQVGEAGQVAILTAAFIVWVFTIGGPFSTYAWYEPFMGSVILGLFTFIAPRLYRGVAVSG